MSKTLFGVIAISVVFTLTLLAVNGDAMVIDVEEFTAPEMKCFDSKQAHLNVTKGVSCRGEFISHKSTLFECCCFVAVFYYIF